MKDLKDILVVNEAKDYSKFKKEDVDALYNILADGGLVYFVNALIAMIEDKNYSKTGWENTELQKLLPKLKSLKQKPF